MTGKGRLTLNTSFLLFSPAISVQSFLDRGGAALSLFIDISAPKCYAETQGGVKPAAFKREGRHSMVLNSIVFFLSLAVSFFLFFFNVPYWTGQDMAEMSTSGIWRAPFRFLSFLGFGFFKLYRTAVYGLPELYFSRNTKHEGLKNSRAWQNIMGLVDILCSAGVLFLLTTAYGWFMDSWFPTGVDTLAEGNDGSLLGVLSEAVVFLRVTAGFKAEGGTILSAAASTVIAAIQYTIINTVFFSILFGYLQELLNIRPFWDLTVGKVTSGLGAAPAEEDTAPQSLPGQLKKAVIDFFNKTTVHTSMENPVSLGLFLLVLLAFSFIMTWLGKNDLGPMDVIRQVLEAIGVVQIVASFAVTYLAGKLGEKAAVAVVNVLPEGMQGAIHSISAKGNEWVKKVDEMRHSWAKKEPSDPSSWSGPRRTPGVHEMDLTGRGKKK